MSDDIKYCDVNNLSELPPLPKGLRYFDFIGGSKEFRCYIVSEDLARNKFMEKHEDLFDDCLKHIYKNNGIVVKQDASYGLPGFYVVSFLKQYRSLDEVDEISSLRIQFILREIRKGMRERLAIQHTHIYYEERNVLSQNVHYWIVPIDVEKHPRLYNFDIKKYLEQFLYKKNKEKIINYNNIMKEYISEASLLNRDNELTATLSKSKKTFRAPSTIDFNITGACNLNCAWCWGPDHTAKEGLTNAQWKQLARRLQILGTENITFTGGEPLMKKGLGDILKYLHNALGIRTTLSTNGLLLKTQANDILPYVDDIGLPLDGPSKETYRLMRVGPSEYFTETLKNIQFVQTLFPTIALTVRTVVSMKNAESVPLIGKTMIDAGIDPERLRWKFYQITPLGQFKKTIVHENWTLPITEFENIIREVKKQNPQFPHISVLTCDMHTGRYFHVYPDGESHVFITGNDGFPAVFPLGNIEKNFDVVLEKLNEFDLTNNDIR